MSVRAIRWSGDDDRYWGPFTYAREPRYRKFAIMLGSGHGDYPGCRLRISIGQHTLIAALPPIIKPWRKWHEITTQPMRSQMIAQGREPGYWDEHAREYGFSFFEGSLHVHLGPQTHDSDTTKSKVFFYPWREHRCIRHSLYDLDGEHFADLPEWGFRHKNGWTVKDAIEGACPVAKYEFADFDGERIVATCRIEEREWRRGKGIFRLLYIGRNRISRSLDLQFSSEVGRRKGSWKGGTIGHSIDMRDGELHESAFRRYCVERGLTFIAPAIEARSDETHSGSAEGESAVPQEGAPTNPGPSA
jgi:hypothetical protein